MCQIPNSVRLSCALPNRTALGNGGSLKAVQMARPNCGSWVNVGRPTSASCTCRVDRSRSSSVRSALKSTVLAASMTCRLRGLGARARSAGYALAPDGDGDDSEDSRTSTWARKTLDVVMDLLCRTAGVWREPWFPPWRPSGLRGLAEVLPYRSDTTSRSTRPARSAMTCREAAPDGVGAAPS